ncbi:integrase core domain-containing protein [Arcanobacterium canis]
MIKFLRHNPDSPIYSNGRKPRPLQTTLAELNTQLDQFRTIYNETRPHRALANTTPHQTYTTQDKAYPYQEHDTKIWRIRYDKVDTTGQITLRYAGKLRKLHIGRAYKHQRVIVLIHDPNTMIIDKTTGEIIAKHTINPATNYQPKKPEQSHETP